MKVHQNCKGGNQMIKRIIELQNEFTKLYEKGIIDISPGKVQIYTKDWGKIAKNQKVSLDYTEDMEHPIKTYFMVDGVKLFSVWTLEEYLNEKK